MKPNDHVSVEGLALAVARVLDGIRDQQGISRSNLARKIGRPQSTINRGLAGERLISLGDLDLICKGLGVTPYAVVAEASRWKDTQI